MNAQRKNQVPCRQCRFYSGLPSDSGDGRYGICKLKKQVVLAKSKRTCSEKKTEVQT